MKQMRNLLPLRRLSRNQLADKVESGLAATRTPRRGGLPDSIPRRRGLPAAGTTRLVLHDVLRYKASFGVM